jgi:hypothetical protein
MPGTPFTFWAGKGRHRAGDRDGPAAASSAAERALRGDTGQAGEPDVGRGDGGSVEDAPAGRVLFALPVFGIIKSVLGFRQISLRGLDKVRGEWSLVTMYYNRRRWRIPWSSHSRTDLKT